MSTFIVWRRKLDRSPSSSWHSSTRRAAMTYVRGSSTIACFHTIILFVLKNSAWTTIKAIITCIALRIIGERMIKMLRQNYETTDYCSLVDRHMR